MTVLPSAFTGGPRKSGLAGDIRNNELVILLLLYDKVTQVETHPGMEDCSLGSQEVIVERTSLHDASTSFGRNPKTVRCGQHVRV